MTCQHKDLTNQHKDLTRQHKDLTSQHKYLTNDGRNMPPFCRIEKLNLKIVNPFHICIGNNVLSRKKYIELSFIYEKLLLLVVL